MEKKRVDWIDVAKGIAIILVVVGHVGSSYHGSGQYVNSAFINFSQQFVYSFHMTLFMFISGILFQKKSDVSAQRKQLLLNYLVPYVTFSAVWWLFKFVMSGFANSSLGVKDLLLIPVFPISFMWFLYALLIMEIVQTFIKNDSVKAEVIQLGTALVLYIIQPLISEIHLFGEYKFFDLGLSDFMINWLYFSIGVILGKRIVSVIEKNRLATLFGAGIALVAGNLLLYKYPVLDSRLCDFILGCFGVSFLITTSQYLQSVRFLKYLGKRTMPVYVLQGYFLAATRIVLGKLHLVDSFGICPLILCTAVSVLIPVVIYEVCQRIFKLGFFFSPGKYIKFQRIE